jgi:hypothetical protein
MSIDRAVLAIAGALILISLGLPQIHHPYWLWLTAIVGANILQSAALAAQALESALLKQ